MTNTVTSKGQTVVPKALRERFNMKSGATLDWQEDGQSLRVLINAHCRAHGHASANGW
jgi:AbrB family looped-hinge helix DNA binding protein